MKPAALWGEILQDFVSWSRISKNFKILCNYFKTISGVFCKELHTGVEDKTLVEDVECSPVLCSVFTCNWRG
jgi:hypothetical protein